MTSLELVRSLHQGGQLTKEAAIGILRTREQIIKQAKATAANDFVLSILMLDKSAGMLDMVSRGGRAARGAISGLASKLTSGGLTPPKPNATPTGWSDVGSNLLKMTGIAGLLAGATAGGEAYLRHRKDKRLQGDIEQSYKAMFDEQPRLTESDQSKVRTYFGVLAKYAPSLAADPTVAASFVGHAVEMGMIDPPAVKNLAETQRRIDEMHEGRSPFSDHFDRSLTLAHKAMGAAGGGKP